MSDIKVVKALTKTGYETDHQTGNHIILRHKQSLSEINVPNHKEIAKGTLRSIIEDAWLTVDAFIDLVW